MDTRPRPRSFPGSTSTKAPPFCAAGEFFASQWEGGRIQLSRTNYESSVARRAAYSSADQSGGSSPPTQGGEKYVVPNHSGVSAPGHGLLPLWGGGNHLLCSNGVLYPSVKRELLQSSPEEA